MRSKLTSIGSPREHGLTLFAALSILRPRTRLGVAHRRAAPYPAVIAHHDYALCLDGDAT
jgi:hypothetical protein